jgi:hypothetical protein
MSHFAIFVIGEDVDGQLSPFCEDLEVAGLDLDDLEFEVQVRKDEIKDYCTKTFEDLDKELRTKGWKWYEKEAGSYFVKRYEAAISKDYEELLALEGYKMSPEGDWGYYYNNAAFWDWYQVGGRWAGYFKLKPGKKGELGELSWANEEEKFPKDRASIALKGDIDVHGMIKEQAEKAGKLYDKVNVIPKTAKSFEKLVKLNNGDIDKAREQYHAQPSIAEFNKLGLWGTDFESFNCTREEYVEKNKFNSFVPYGIVKDGEYYSNGDMGWFGISTNDKPNWDEEFMKIWHEIDDDQLITVVDCHI